MQFEGRELQFKDQGKDQLLVRGEPARPNQCRPGLYALWGRGGGALRCMRLHAWWQQTLPHYRRPPPLPLAAPAGAVRAALVASSCGGGSGSAAAKEGGRTGGWGRWRGFNPGTRPWTPPPTSLPCARPLQKFIEECGVDAKVDGPLNFKGGKYTVLLVPNK
jgi:hypothetical protein